MNSITNAQKGVTHEKLEHFYKKNGFEVKEHQIIKHIEE